MYDSEMINIRNSNSKKFGKNTITGNEIHDISITATLVLVLVLVFILVLKLVLVLAVLDTTHTHTANKGFKQFQQSYACCNHQNYLLSELCSSHVSTSCS